MPDSKDIKGLGDVIEKVTKVTGIQKIVEKITPEDEDCGCAERRDKLNEAFPIGKK